MRRVVLSDSAVRSFKRLSKVEQSAIKDGIRLHLIANDPALESRNKFRLRRVSAWAEFELRLGDLRVFYHASSREVQVVLIGRKVGQVLMVDGEAFML